MKAWTDEARNRSLEVRRLNAKNQEALQKIPLQVGRRSKPGEIEKARQTMSRTMVNTPTKHIDRVFKDGTLKGIFVARSSAAMAEEYRVREGWIDDKIPAGFYDREEGRMFIDFNRFGQFSAEQTVLHEFAHAVFESLERNSRGAGKGRPAMEKAKKLITELDKVWVTEYYELSNHASWAANRIETFCEAYGLYFTGGPEQEYLKSQAPKLYALMERIAKW